MNWGGGRGVGGWRGEGSLGKEWCGWGGLERLSIHIIGRVLEGRCLILDGWPGKAFEGEIRSGYTP